MDNRNSAIVLKEEFKTLLKNSFGADIALPLIEVVEEGAKAPVCVRLNNNKLPFAEESGLEIGRQVAWSKGTYYVEGGKVSGNGQLPSFTLDPLFHAGLYYVQDASSTYLSIAAPVVSELLDDFDGCGQAPCILDLCAAPGGKSTHLLSLFPNSILLSNEAIPKRVMPLCDNIAKWGNSNVIVTNSDAASLGRSGLSCRLIVADVPCSGEGMLRKSEEALKQWSPNLVAECAALQRQIVSDIWPALEDGGVMLYSTCTYNHIENSDNVAFICKELGAEEVVLDSEYLKREYNILRVEHGYQFLPLLLEGEGQFFSILRKKGGACLGASKGGANRRAAKNVDIKNYSKFSDLQLFNKGSAELFALPAHLGEPMLKLYALLAAKGITAKMFGTAVGEIKGSKIIPAADFALSATLAKELKNSGNFSLKGLSFATYSLDYKCAIDYLAKEKITPSLAPQGYLLFKYKNLGLGFANNVGNRINNLYPNQRRIRTLLR